MSRIGSTKIGNKDYVLFIRQFISEQIRCIKTSIQMREKRKKCLLQD